MNHLTLAEVNPDNYRLYIEKPDSHFSPERNYQVVQQVIAENDQMQLKMHKDVERNAGNVADILSSFAKYKLDIGGGKQIEDWLGKSWMTRIYGEKLCEKIRMMDFIKRKNIQNGNTKFENFYLT